MPALNCLWTTEVPPLHSLLKFKASKEGSLKRWTSSLDDEVDCLTLSYVVNSVIFVFTYSLFSLSLLTQCNASIFINNLEILCTHVAVTRWSPY